MPACTKLGQFSRLLPSFLSRTHGQTLLQKSVVHIISWLLSVRHDHVGTNFGSSRSAVITSKYLWVCFVSIVYLKKLVRHFVPCSVLCWIIYVKYWVRTIRELKLIEIIFVCSVWQASDKCYITQQHHVFRTNKYEYGTVHRCAGTEGLYRLYGT